MKRPRKKPTTWPAIEAALAEAEVNGARRALQMARPLGTMSSSAGNVSPRIASRAFERAIEILQSEAEEYRAATRSEK